MQVDIRRFQIDDLPWVAHILAQLTKADPLETHYTHLDENYISLVALLNDQYVSSDLYIFKPGQVVGFGSVFLLRKFFKPRPVALIEDVVVDERLHGKGIGRQVVEQLINWAKLSNAYKVILNCSEQNVEFYKKLGFHEKEKQMRLDL